MVSDQRDRHEPVERQESSGARFPLDPQSRARRKPPIALRGRSRNVAAGTGKESAFEQQAGQKPKRGFPGREPQRATLHAPEYSGEGGCAGGLEGWHVGVTRRASLDLYRQQQRWRKETQRRPVELDERKSP